jgi:Xaa-Pro aminopeptidase
VPYDPYDASRPLESGMVVSVETTLQHPQRGFIKLEDTVVARRRFSPLSAGSSVLDALWIVAIILEQPAYALIVPSRPIRF